MIKNLNVILAISATLLLVGCDTIRVTGGDGFEIGLLIDGTAAGNVHNDDRATGTDGTSIIVGSFDAGPGEVIAYTVGHAPTLGSAAWTAGDDAITFPFEPKYRVKFKIWVVNGPFADGQTKAVNACIKTSQIWRDERQGTSFSTFDIVDVTGNATAANYTAFDCGKVAGIKTDIGFDNAAVNAYWVNTVDFGSGAATSNGVWCGGNVVAMGWNTLDHLFSHEVGHAFSLDHVNSLAAFFDTTNVMHNASNSRSFLTEGQTFRAVANSGSVVNTLGGRTTATRNCGNSTATGDAACPPVQKRIWADGAAWPAN